MLEYRQKAVIHVDFDGAGEIFAGHGVSYPFEDDAIFESGVENLLEFLQRNGVRATFFVVASNLDAPRKRRLLERAVAEGHEVASHTLTHAYLRSIDSSKKRVEISESRARLEGELGVRVQGFRAPGYRIDRESIQLLEEFGYEWDSSAYATPQFANHLNVRVESLSHPGMPFAGQKLIELPLPDHRPSPIPTSPSYALVLGSWYYAWGIERFARTAKPLVMLFHLIDFAAPLAAERLPSWKLRLFTLSSKSAEQKRVQCQEMLDRVRRHYNIVPTAELIRDVRKGPLSPPSEDLRATV